MYREFIYIVVMFNRALVSVVLCSLNRVPVLVTAVLLISGEEGDYTIDQAFFYGRPQVRFHPTPDVVTTTTKRYTDVL